METSKGDDGIEAEPTRSFNFNTVFGLGFIAFSIVLFLIIPDQIEKPLVIIFMSENDLNAALFPQVVATCFGGLGIWLFFKSFSIAEVNKVKALKGEAITNVAITLLAMAVYGPLMMQIGFVVSSALVIAFLATFFGNRHYLMTAIVSVTIPVMIFYIFTKLLATYLPPFPIDTVLTPLYIL
jgi:hypothetical protein